MRGAWSELLSWVCRTGRVFLQSDVEEAATDMFHMFRQHGRADFEIDLSGCPITEETLLRNLDRSVLASAPSADISAIGSAAFNQTGSEAAAAQASSSADADAGLEAGMLKSSAVQSAAGQQAEEDSREAAFSGTSAARIEWEPDVDTECEPAVMQEPIEWLDANPLVWLWLLVLNVQSSMQDGQRILSVQVQTHESKGFLLSLLPLRRGFQQREKFTLYKTAAAYTALCSYAFDRDLNSAVLNIARVLCNTLDSRC